MTPTRAQLAKRVATLEAQLVELMEANAAIVNNVDKFVQRKLDLRLQQVQELSDQAVSILSKLPEAVRLSLRDTTRIQ